MQVCNTHNRQTMSTCRKCSIEIVQDSFSQRQHVLIMSATICKVAHCTSLVPTPPSAWVLDFIPLHRTIILIPMNMMIRKSVGYCLDPKLVTVLVTVLLYIQIPFHHQASFSACFVPIPAHWTRRTKATESWAGRLT